MFLYNWLRSQIHCKSCPFEIIEATYSYTIESSVHGYGPKATEKLFNNEELINVGEQMGPGFLNFMYSPYSLSTCS